ncbi:MAG: UDP-4-amino-4,6-dideoxy-N-acetyl-beta-L-altrosamine N-acetyltransferase [Psychrobium sp.]
MPHVSFRPITEQDIELVRQWRNSQRVNSQMLNQQMITQESQRAWFESIKNNSSQKHFLCLLDQRPVGVLNFVDITNDDCEWGCYIGEERVLPGIGLVLEAAALYYSFNHLNIKLLNANVLADNKGPQAMHRLFGYQELTAKNVTNASGDVLTMSCFCYQREQWALNYRAVCAKLPKPILKVIETITFIDE